MSSFALRLLAFCSMACDHLGLALFPGAADFRAAGRLAFPLYCFLLAEGARRTSDRKRYFLRLLALALPCELLFDLLLFDVKHFDSEKHKKGTGLGNELILRNLRWAHEQGLTVLPRVPVIPGFNADLSDAEGIAGLLQDTGLVRVQLLPFHQMGERKYEFLNRDYELTEVKALHEEDLTEYQKVFIDHGIDCFF